MRLIVCFKRTIKLDDEPLIRINYKKPELNKKKLFFASNTIY
jgi:hypothetical protein